MAKKNVGIGSMAYTPSSVSINKGDCICWTNGDAAAHTVTFDNPGAPFSSGQLAPQAAYETPFPDAGTFPYHCANHPDMKGVVTVS